MVLNLLDAIFTLQFVSAGVATEANPLMDYLLSHNPLLFMVGKLALVSVGILLLWHLRTKRLAIAGIVTSLAIYTLIVAYHVAMHFMLA